MEKQDQRSTAPPLVLVIQLKSISQPINQTIRYQVYQSVNQSPWCHWFIQSSSWVTQGSPWGQPEVILGHPGVILGQPEVMLGHPGVILG